MVMKKMPASAGIFFDMMKSSSVHLAHVLYDTEQF